MTIKEHTENLLDLANQLEHRYYHIAAGHARSLIDELTWVVDELDHNETEEARINRVKEENRKKA